MPQQRLELTWIGKGEEPQLEPRLLIEDPDKSYGEADTENMLIHGDNLLALKALEQEYAGKVKCVFIDPPYNTGSAFEHYDDGVEHSTWLSLMHARLTELRKLLTDDGTIWIVIDDNECHYLKVMCDEIFGRGTFVSSIAWRSADSSNNDSKQFSNDYNTILVYSKNPGWESYPLPRDEKANKHYKNPDNDPNGRWFSGNVSSPNPRPNLMYTLTSPLGKKVTPPSNGWRWNKERMQSMIASGEVVFSEDQTRIIKKTYLKNQKGLAPSNLWSDIDDTGHNRQAKYELKRLFPEKETSELFKTPKPEKVVMKALMVATKEGDLVLDSFLGSGTTASVAHKMNRKWIGVELGSHAQTVCLPRLKKVVDGLDEGGITKAQNWRGGGGFKFYNLAPSLLRKDDLGQWVIDEAYNADQLAAAMAKHEGYTYAPDADRYWKQAYSTENDFLYTTTQLVTAATIDHLAEQLGPAESLLICCKAYQSAAEGRDARINLHKIPAMLADRCEFGKDDYSLNIVDAPKDEEQEPFVPAGQLAAKEAEAEELRKYGRQKEMFD